MTRLDALRLLMDGKRHGNIRLSREETVALLNIAAVSIDRHHSPCYYGKVTGGCPQCDAHAPMLEDAE